MTISEIVVLISNIIGTITIAVFTVGIIIGINYLVRAHKRELELQKLRSEIR